MKKILTLLGATAIASTAFGTVNTLFQDDADLAANFYDIKGDANSTVTASSGQLYVEDLSTGDKPECYYDFSANILDGFRLDLTYEFDNSAILDADIISDPEIRLRFGNLGTEATSDSKTGFALLFRNSSAASVNSVRAGYWNGSKVSSTDAVVDVADNASASLTVFANNAYVSQTYSYGGSDYTLEANTYDLFVAGAYVNTYALGEDALSFDRDLGFGTLGFMGSSDSDSGVSMIFDDLIVYTGADSGLTAVPEPSTYAALAGLLALGFAASRRRRA